MSDSCEETIEKLKAQLKVRDKELAELKNLLSSVEGGSGISGVGVNLGISSGLESEGARIASLGGWQYDTESRVVFWTPEVFRIHGLKQGKVPPLEECVLFYSGEDRKRFKDAFRSLSDDGAPFDLECELMDANGQRRFVRTIGRVLEERENGSRVLSGAIQDITKQHLMRRGMDAFFTLTPDLVGAVDFESRPVTLSPSWRALFGLAKKCEMNRCGIDCVVHEEDRGAMREVIRRAIESGKIESIQNRVFSENGDLHWFSWRLFADWSTKMLFISAVDVTRRVNVENALREAKVQADLANRAKSEFLAIMSHELRTPLNPILGFADLLIDETENPEHVEILESISAAGQHLTKVIGDVLDFAKIEAGRAEIEEDEFNLYEEVGKQVRLMQGQLNGTDVKLSWEFNVSRGIDRETIVVGDREKIVRVLHNLMGNAIKFTDHGSVELESTLTLSDDGRVFWNVQVTDTGIGIPSSSLEEIFEPFCQVDSSTTRKHGGSGLGLAICRKLVELMGGEIDVESRYGEGTCFSFLLPLKLGKVVPEMGDGFKNEGSLLISGGKRVLLVEDNSTNVFYIRRLLEKMDCIVTVVTSGEEALAQYHPGQVDLILLDIHMPGVSGIVVLQEIRSEETLNDYEKVPIIMLTADVLPTTRATCMKNGANGFLNKPVRVAELNRAINEVFDLAS